MEIIQLNQRNLTKVLKKKKEMPFSENIRNHRPSKEFLFTRINLSDISWKKNAPHLLSGNSK